MRRLELPPITAIAVAVAIAAEKRKTALAYARRHAPLALRQDVYQGCLASLTK